MQERRDLDLAWAVGGVAEKLLVTIPRSALLSVAWCWPSKAKAKATPAKRAPSKRQEKPKPEYSPTANEVLNDETGARTRAP